MWSGLSDDDSGRVAISACSLTAVRSLISLKATDCFGEAAGRVGPRDPNQEAVLSARGASLVLGVTLFACSLGTPASAQNPQPSAAMTAYRALHAFALDG